MDISSYNLGQIESALLTIDKTAYLDRYNALEAAKTNLIERITTIEDEFELITGERIDFIRESKIKPKKSADIALYAFTGAVSITLLVTIFAVFGANVISWNGSNVHGLQAILVGAILSVFLGLVIMLITSIGSAVSKVIFKR